jgi:hypothetical protein
MNGDFSLFVDFQLDSKAYDAEYAILARPGMHMGIMIKKIKPDYSLLCWDYWTVGLDGQHKWNSIHIELFANQNITPNDRYFIYIQHTVGERHFKAHINSAKFKEPIVLEQRYEGKLVDYSETPYNIGCGNYGKVVPKRDRLFTACTIYKLGLIGTNDYTYEQIIKFLDTTKDDVTNLSKSLFDIVFYFNFNLTNIYKVWDLSGHCNFMQKNLYIEDEETYLTDSDFYEDYANK